MKYSIIIPTYNHCDDLLKPCIESIIEYTDLQNVEIIIAANGCVDNTKEYIAELYARFVAMNIPDNLKLTWSDLPTGYSKASNDGIKISTCDKIILLNNDVLILDQIKNTWIELLHSQFQYDPKCGISGPSKVFSGPANRDFLIFFCVMIDRKVFDVIGLLNEEYGKGGGEDTEFCILAENAGFHLNLCAKQVWSDKLNLYVGEFPIYHRGEGTVHDKVLVPDYDEVFETNSLKLGKKFNPEWYRWKLSNNLERAVYLQGHKVDIREELRYSWAAQHIIGAKVLDIGCSSGYGAQFFDPTIEYTGIDYDYKIIQEANAQNWLPNAKFIHANLADFEINFTDTYDTIVAFEVIEHLSNGLEFVETLKQRCNQIIITVPYNESVNVFNPHHLLRNLTPDKFKDFNIIGFINLPGDILQEDQLIAGEEYSLLMEWKKEKSAIKDFSWLNTKYPDMYNEIIKLNVYDVDEKSIKNRNVLDIGANIGTFSLLANYYGAKKIIAIEPTHKTFNQLLENIMIVGKTNITPIMSAVSDISNKIIKIHTNDNSGLNSQYNNSHSFNYSSTLSLSDTLKQFEDDPKIFLKVDCEGAEYDILLNTSQEDMNKIDNVAIEIHADMHPTHKGFDLIEQKLINSGFNLKNKKQIYSWNYNKQDKIVDQQAMPIVIEMWERQKSNINQTEIQFWSKTN